MAYIHVSSYEKGEVSELDLLSISSCPPGWRVVRAWDNFSDFETFEIAAWGIYKNEHGYPLMLAIIGDRDIGCEWIACGGPDDPFTIGILEPGEDFRVAYGGEIEDRLKIMRDMFEERNKE